MFHDQMSDAAVDALLDIELGRGPSHWDAWEVSRSGNWYTVAHTADGRKVVTIFERPKGSGRWAYSVKGTRKKDAVRFSARSYPTQEAARDAVETELKGGA